MEPMVVIEDEANIRDALELVFNGMFEVRAFASAEDALKMDPEAARVVRVIFLDGILGYHMDGEAALPLIKAKFPGASVIFMGALGGLRREELRAQGVALVLPKPWNLEELREAARSCSRAASR